jgi:hypothetical protein
MSLKEDVGEEAITNPVGLRRAFASTLNNLSYLTFPFVAIAIKNMRAKYGVAILEDRDQR